MKQKQKNWKKYIAACSVLMMLFSVWATPVYAEETRDLFALPQQTETDAAAYSAISDDLMSANADGGDSVIPVFGLLITDGENQMVTSAFYLRDTFGGGSTYLVSIANVLLFLEEGFDVFLFGTDGFETEVTGGSVFSEDGYAFLQADGLDRYEPMEMTETVSAAGQGVLYFALDGKTYFTAYEELDMNDWQSEGTYYTGKYQVKNSAVLGGPVIDLQSAQVWGMMNMTSDTAGVIVDANQMQFDPEAAIVKGDGAVSSGVPSGGTGSGGSVFQPWMGLVLVGAIGILVGKKRKGAKQKPVQEAPGADNNGTVILDKKEEVPEMVTDGKVGIPMEPFDRKAPPGERFYCVDYGKTEPVGTPRYQLRGMNGTFKGQIFEVRGSIKIGRDPLCGISYPQETGGISGNHCLVMEEAEGILLRDLGSTYGTFYGGVKMQPQMDYHLTEGDTFYLADGKHTFRVERVGESRQEFTPVIKAVTLPAAGMLYHANANKEIYFGRGNGTQVQFTENDTKISAKHCVLYRDNTGLYLMDLGSTNGTFLSETLRLKPNVPYRMEKGSAFFLATPKYTFVVTED